MLPEQRAHSRRKQLETGFRQDKVKVIWHRVLPVKCSDLPCLHTVDLIYSLPHPLSFSLHLFSAVIFGHSLPLYWSVLIRTPKSCIIFKYSRSIPKLCLSIPQYILCPFYTVVCRAHMAFQRFLCWVTQMSCVTGLGLLPFPLRVSDVVIQRG